MAWRGAVGGAGAVEVGQNILLRLIRVLASIWVSSSPSVTACPRESMSRSIRCIPRARVRRPFLVTSGCQGLYQGTCSARDPVPDHGRRSDGGETMSGARITVPPDRW